MEVLPSNWHLVGGALAQLTYMLTFMLSYSAQVMLLTIRFILAVMVAFSRYLKKIIFGDSKFIFSQQMPKQAPQQQILVILPSKLPFRTLPLIQAMQPSNFIMDLLGQVDSHNLWLELKTMAVGNGIQELIGTTLVVM
jgi:hypothetical protein